MFAHNLCHFPDKDHWHFGIAQPTLASAKTRIAIPRKSAIVKIMSAMGLLAHRTTNAARNARKHLRRSLGYADPPKVIVLFLTDRCNLRCKMCAQYGENGVSIGRPLVEMPLSLVCSIVDQVECFKPQLIFMGGEPMFHRQWVDALRYARRRGLSTRMITNGTMLRQHVGTLIDEHMDCLTVSVDGTEESHNRIRGKGTFRVVRQALLALRDARRERKSGHPWTTVACTISDVTAPVIVSLARQMADEDWGIDEMVVQHLSWLFPEQLERHNAQLAAQFGIEALNMAGLVTHPGAIDIDRLISDLETLTSGLFPFRVTISPEFPLDEVREYYTGGEAYRRRTPERCQFIWNATSVYPQGTMTPCMNFVPGSLAEQPFLELWNSPEYRRFRRMLWRNGHSPVCHRCCNR